MNTRSFFKSLALLTAGAAVAPGIFIPKFEPVRWKVQIVNDVVFFTHDGALTAKQVEQLSKIDLESIVAIGRYRPSAREFVAARKLK